jgi:hypothetical protein
LKSTALASTPQPAPAIDVLVLCSGGLQASILFVFEIRHLGIDCEARAEQYRPRLKP